MENWAEKKLCPLEMSPPYQSSKWPHNKWKRNFTLKDYVWTTFTAIPKWILTVPLFDQSQIFWMPICERAKENIMDNPGRNIVKILRTPQGGNAESTVYIDCPLHKVSINDDLFFLQGLLLIFFLPASPRIWRCNFLKTCCTFISRVFPASSHCHLAK